MQADKFERQLWQSHIEEVLGVSPEGHFWCRLAEAGGLLQSFKPEANAGLFVHTARRDPRRLYQ